MMFEIYTDENKEKSMEIDIDKLFGYPKGGKSPFGKSRPNIITVKYRNILKHPTKKLWAGAVDIKLKDKCKQMTKPEQEKYYISLDLKDYKYLVDNGWFPDPIPPLIGE